MLLLKIHSIYLLVSPTADSCITWYTRDKNKIELWKCLLSSTCCPSTEHCRESLNPGVDWDLFFRDCMSSWEDPPDAVRTPLIYLQMREPTVLRLLLHVSHHSSRLALHPAEPEPGLLQPLNFSWPMPGARRAEYTGYFNFFTVSSWKRSGRGAREGRSSAGARGGESAGSCKSSSCVTAPAIGLVDPGK